MRTSLKRLVLAAVATASLVTVGGAAAYDVAEELRKARERAAQHGERLAALGAPVTLSALIVNDLATAEQTLRAMNADRDYARIALLEPNAGEMLLDASPAASSPSAAPAWFRRLLAAELPETRVALEAGGVLYGFILAQPSARSVEEQVWSHLRAQAVLAVLLLAALTLAAERALALGLRPFQQLARLAGRFGAGEYGARMWPSRILEADRLGRAFNDMAEKLEREMRARLENERRLAEAKQAAELANRSKSEFLANMSHELRTPLNAIIGFADMMREETFGPLGSPRYREYVAAVQDSGAHLLAVVNDLLDVSAIEAERMELQEAEVDLAHLVASATRLMAPRCEAAGVALHVALDPAAPAVWADERRLKQALLNLLSNAAKFTPRGGEVRLSVGLDAAGDLEIAVVDTGIGMDADGLAKAMERFGQVDGGLSRKHEGTGLGLPLTRGLVELHGGRLRLDSALGVGTTATVILPRERLTPAKARAYG